LSERLHFQCEIIDDARGIGAALTFTSIDVPRSKEAARDSFV